MYTHFKKYIAHLLSWCHLDPDSSQNAISSDITLATKTRIIGHSLCAEILSHIKVML